MIKFLILLIFFSACTHNRTQNISLETLESRTGVALEKKEKELIYKRNKETLKRLSQCQSLKINDIVTLSEAGISDNFTICYLLFTKKQYNLSSLDIRKLERHAVSQRVIRHLIQSGK